MSVNCSCFHLDYCTNSILILDARLLCLLVRSYLQASINNTSISDHCEGKLQEAVASRRE